jgi:PhnB protein
MTLDGRLIMMGQGAKEKGMASVRETGTATQGVFIYLADVDAHCARARAAGAEIVRPIEDLPYGRSYSARDLEGHPWFFTTPPAGG